MITDQLNLIKNQTKAMLRNEASGAVAKVRKETSLVQQASRLTGRVKRGMDQVEQNIVHSRKTGSPRVETETVAQTSTVSKPAPDGYVRKSPVQPIRVPADYHRQLLRRIFCGAVAVICVLAIVWLLLQSGLLAK